MLPFVLPLLMAAGGAGLGALTNKKNRLKGALTGAALGGLGGWGLGAAGVGAGASAAGHSLGAATAASTAGRAAGGLGGLKGMLTMQNMAKLAPMMGRLGAGQQEPEQPMLPPISYGGQPTPIAPLGQGQGRPMAPPVQMAYNRPQYGGYYG